MMSKSLFSKWCDQAWLYAVYLFAIIMANIFILQWTQWDDPQRLICLLAVGIPMHVFEENSWPGGFFFMNNLGFGSKDPTVYPQNRCTNMITNFGAEIIFILLTCFATNMEPTVVTVVIFFGIFETVNHTREGIGMYRRYREKGKRTIYAPGLITSWIVLLPMAIYGISWLTENSFNTSEIFAGIGISVGIAVCLIILPFIISSKVKSKEYAFTNIGYFEKYENQ